MNSPAYEQPQPFQFNMATGLRVVTGLSVILSLVTWQPVLGTMLSSLVVGSWWSRAAVRAGWRKLAYYLAAWAMGGIVFVVGCLPFTILVLLTAEPDSEALIPLLLMHLAWLITARLLRGKIRRSEQDYSAGLVFLTVYTTSAVFTVLFSIGGAIYWAVTGYGSLEILWSAIAASLLGQIFSVIWATVLMPVAWPVALGLCAILRRVDPEPPGTSSRRKAEWAAVRPAVSRNVDTWWPDVDGPLQAEKLARRLCIDPETAAEQLEILCRLEILEKTEADGYRRK